MAKTAAEKQSDWRARQKAVHAQLEQAEVEIMNQRLEIEDLLKRNADLEAELASNQSHCRIHKWQITTCHLCNQLLAQGSDWGA
jgi:chromosome segregation ATPase